MKIYFTTCRRAKRRKSGASVTELLVASLLLAVSMGVIGELMAVMTLSASRLTNRVDVVNNAAQTLIRIDTDIRAASNFQTNFLGGQLGSQKLIIETPVFSNDVANTGSYPIRYDTIVYEVTPDPAKSDQFLLKRSRTVGPTPPSLNPANFPSSSPPEIVASGIIGPRSISDNSVAIFSYFKKIQDPNNSSETTVQELPPTLVPFGQNSIVGVSIDLEMKRPNSSGGAESQSQQLTLHSESYLHSNATN